MRPTEVSHKVCIPKKGDRQGWSLLKKINDTASFKRSPKGSLAEFWYYGGGISSTSHLLKEERRQFYTPHKDRDYNEWVLFMKNTKFVKSPRNEYDRIQSMIDERRSREREYERDSYVTDYLK
jgi:hypothetical protein